MFKMLYDGMVPMEPNMEKAACISDENFSYALPNIYFDCIGEASEDELNFKWSDDSVVIIKDKRIVKYTESTFKDVLVADGETHTWLHNRDASFYRFDENKVEDAIPRKQFMISEYDLDKHEKRTYEVVLKEVSDINEDDKDLLYPYLEMPYVPSHLQFIDEDIS